MDIQSHGISHDCGEMPTATVSSGWTVQDYSLLIIFRNNSKNASIGGSEAFIAVTYVILYHFDLSCSGPVIT